MLATQGGTLGGDAKSDCGQLDVAAVGPERGYSRASGDVLAGPGGVAQRFCRKRGRSKRLYSNWHPPLAETATSACGTSTVFSANCSAPCALVSTSPRWPDSNVEIEADIRGELVTYSLQFWNLQVWPALSVSKAGSRSGFVDRVSAQVPHACLTAHRHSIRATRTTPFARS